VTDPGHGAARPGPAVAGIALAVLSADTFGTSGIFASALISTGWSPAAVATARLGGSAVLLGVPAVLQLRGRWALLRRQAGTVVVYGVVAIASSLSRVWLLCTSGRRPCMGDQYPTREST
jgi:hypothetical protein